MKVTVLSVGKIKEKFLKNGIRDYMQRLKHYTRIKIVNVKDEKTPKNASMAELEKVKNTEGKRLLKRINNHSYKIALSVSGEHLTSKELAAKIKDLRLHGKSDITFIIGGAYGLSKEVLNSSDFVLSFSDMTFTHQMIRLILLEQLYRAFKIIKKEPYHH